MAFTLLKVLLTCVAVCSGSDAAESRSASQEQRPEHLHKAHSTTKMSNLYLRKRTEKVLNRGTDWLMSKMPGAPQLFGNMIEGGIKDFVMQLRSSSATRQHFIDYLAGELDRVNGSDMGVKQVVGMLSKAANHTKVEEPLQLLLAEADRQLSTVNSTKGISAKEGFEMLSAGVKRLGMPEEVTSMLEGVEPVVEVLSRPEGPDPTSIFSFLGAFYKNLGMPDEVVDILSEFGNMFTQNSSAMEGPQAMKFLSRMVEKLGLPAPITKFLDFMGHSMETNTTDNATAALEMVGEAMTGLGAPPEMTGAIMQIAKIAENSENATSQEMMGKIGGLLSGISGGIAVPGAPGGDGQPMMPPFNPQDFMSQIGPQMMASLFGTPPQQTA